MRIYGSNNQEDLMPLPSKYFSAAALTLLALWLAIGGFVTVSYVECSTSSPIWFPFPYEACSNPLIAYGLIYFAASTIVLVSAFRFITSNNEGNRKPRSDDLGNFLIFLGGMMIVAGLIAPYFTVGLRLLEGYWGIGVVLLVIGILFRRFLAP